MTASIATRLISRPTAPLDGLAADVWGAFVDRVALAVLEAQTIIRNGKAPIDYVNSIGWWRDGERKIGQTSIKVPAENSVTDLLVRTLQHIRAEAEADDLLRRMEVQFSQQVPRQTQRRIGSKALTTDLRAYSGAIPDLDLRIEAKILFGGNDLAGYCGSSGLLRFGDIAEPYTDAPFGIMLAYTMRHDKQRWKNALMVKAGGGADVLSAGQLWYASDMIRLTDCTTVMHLSLDFDTEPESRAEDLRRALKRNNPPHNPQGAT